MRWRAAEVVLERFGGGSVLMARRGGPGRVVSLADARVLVACDSFALDDEHAGRVADDLELTRAEVVAALGRLRDLGLLLSEDDARLTILTAGARAEAPPPIAAAGVLTCERPELARRALAGLAGGRRLPIWLCDDSRSPAAQAATREVAEAARRDGVDVRLLGREAKARLADALTVGGGARELVQLALFGLEGVGTTTGANRNAFRLVTAGRLSLLIDDDVTARTASPRGAAPGIRFLSDEDGVELWFHPSIEAAVADGDFQDTDLVALHEQLLGRSLADCARRHGAAGLDLDGAAAPLLARLTDGSGRVLITQSGHAGDAGIGNSATFLRLSGANRARLAADYHAVRHARALHRGTTRLVVTGAPHLMGATTGLDGRHLLPPWMPFLRNSDGVLGAFTRAVHADGYLGHLPRMVEHRPPAIRRLAHDDARRGIAELRFSELIQLVVGGFAPLPHASPADSLDALGRHLVALGALPPADFSEALRALRWEEAGRQAHNLEDTASAGGALGDEAAAALDELRAAMAGVVVVTDAGPRAQDLVGRFGELCRGWPEILAAASRCDAGAVV